MSKLSITNRTVTLDSTVYQVSNITSVGKYRIKSNYRFKLRSIAIYSFLGFIGIHWVQNNPDISIAKWFTGIFLTLAILGTLERFLKPKKYGLSIETNSGGIRLLSSNNGKFLQNIVDKLIEIMNNRDQPAHYTFNVSEGDIINQSGSFETGVKY